MQHKGRWIPGLLCFAWAVHHCYQHLQQHQFMCLFATVSHSNEDEEIPLVQPIVDVVFCAWIRCCSFNAGAGTCGLVF